MKGYSKIQLHGSKKSRSMDFSDLTHHLPQTPRKPTKIIKNPDQLASKEDQEAKQIKTHETHLEEDQEAKQIKTHETHLEEDQEESKQMKKTHLEGEEEDKSGQRFGVILSRNLSVSSTTSSSSHRFRYEKEQKQEDNLQSAVRRAFSMRRSSSVAERYSKIHDQYVTLSSSFQEDDDGEVEDDEIDKNKNNTVMKKKKKRSNMILKACKRIFGL